MSAPRGVCSGGVSVVGGRCLLPAGVSAPGWGCLLWGVSTSGGVSSRGTSAPGGWCLLGGGGIPACTEADTPPVDRITDTSKNITLATTSLRPVKIDNLWFYDFASGVLLSYVTCRLLSDMNTAFALVCDLWKRCCKSVLNF